LCKKQKKFFIVFLCELCARPFWFSPSRRRYEPEAGLSGFGGIDKMANQSIISEFWEFLKFRKRYWLLPIVLVLFLFGALIVFTESSAVAPFIYALF